MTLTREQVVQMRKKADEYAESQSSDLQEIGEISDEHFATLAFNAGRARGLGEAKEVCTANSKRWPDLRGFYVANECAAAIEQLKEKT